MKEFLIGAVTVAIFSSIPASSTIVGDINQDGKIDVTEAIYALQIASGAYPTIDDSCLLTGQGSWETGKNYNFCDVVTHSGSTYACITAHTSITGSAEPPDETYWTVLSVNDGNINWSEINNRPAGLDDGDDVGITAESDPTVTESVKDGVSWSELTSIPAGFADNTDNDSGGDITSVTAGAGLSGGGSIGSVTLSHDDTSSQLSINNSNGYVIQDVFLDTNGHLTGMGSVNLDSRFYTKTDADNNFVNVSGDSMQGALSITGALKVSPTGGSAVTSNAMRINNTSIPSSGDITSTGDLFISNDFEVGDQIYASKRLYMNGNNSTGDDGDQTIFFYNDGIMDGEFIRWNDFEGRFDLSAPLKVDGHLTVTGVVDLPDDSIGEAEITPAVTQMLPVAFGNVRKSTSSLTLNATVTGTTVGLDTTANIITLSAPTGCNNNSDCIIIVSTGDSNHYAVVHGVNQLTSHNRMGFALQSLYSAESGYHGIITLSGAYINVNFVIYKMP